MFTTALGVLITLPQAVSVPPPHCDGRWSAAPGATPSNDSPDGPVLGNGALGVAISATAPSTAGNMSTLVFHIDRNDAWVPATGDLSCCGYDMDGAGGRTLGLLSLAFPAFPPKAGAPAPGFRAAQHIANGTVTTGTDTDHGGTLRTASFVARGTDVLVTEVWWDVPVSPGPPPPPLQLVIVNEPVGCTGWTQGCYCHVLKQNKSQLWSSKQIGHPYQNVPTSTIGRRHLYKAALATAVVAPPGPPPAPPTPSPGLPPAHPPSECLVHDSDCGNCLGTMSADPRWPGACLMLNITLPSPYNGLVNPHSCVPSSWWQEFKSSYPVAHSCKSCTDDKTCPHIPRGPEPRRFTLSPDGTKTTVVTAVLSNFDPDYLPVLQRDPTTYPDPTVPAQQLALQSSKAAFELRTNATVWWAEYWAKSSVSLPLAPAMENQWYRALYVLASSHRTDGSPFSVAPGIVWPKTTDGPNFRGAFTMNYNQQALYYGIYAANHAEIGTPYYNAIIQYIPRGRKDAETQFQCPGINMECEIFHWGQTVSGLGDQGQRSNAALAAVPIANHWLWTRDVDWLNTTGWTYLDEIAKFWECYLQKGFNYPGAPNGSYSSVNDCLGELCCLVADFPGGYPNLDFPDPELVHVNPHITLSLLRFLFPVFVDAAETLGIEPERRTLWKHLHANLAPLPLVHLANNMTIFGNIMGSDSYSSNDPLNSYLGWPGYDDALTTDTTLRQTLKNTLDVLPMFDCGNGWPQYPPSRVRLQDYATQANATWRSLIALMTYIPANGIVGDPPGAMMTAMEGAGGIGIVNELLLQSHTGVIELFPQVPPGQPAGFTNLRGRGAFLVSASMAAGDRAKIGDVVIVSEKGMPVTLRSPWASHPSISVAPSSGAAVEVRSTINGVFSWDTQPGVTYAVAPK